jgi:hypothetical protein
MKQGRVKSIRRRSNFILIKPERASATATKLQSRLGQTRGWEADEGRWGNIGCEVNTSSTVNPPAHDASNMERCSQMQCIAFAHAHAACYTKMSRDLKWGHQIARLWRFNQATPLQSCVSSSKARRVGPADKHELLKPFMQPLTRPTAP